MSRKVAVIWHALFWIAAGVLYFLFVLPRWWELAGDTTHTLGTVLRIVAGALIGLAALPVVFTLLRTRRPELGTPQLALTLRTWSIALHVLAGVLIVGTAISEIWLSLDSAGRWLFGVYGAAAAVALLGIFAFYLAFVAELPPPPPKPLKPKAEKKQRRGRRKAAEEAADDTEIAEESAVDDHCHLRGRRRARRGRGTRRDQRAARSRARRGHGREGRRRRGRRAIRVREGRLRGSQRSSRHQRWTAKPALIREDLIA